MQSICGQEDLYIVETPTKHLDKIGETFFFFSPTKVLQAQTRVCLRGWIVLDSGDNNCFLIWFLLPLVEKNKKKTIKIVDGQK